MACRELRYRYAVLGLDVSELEGREERADSGVPDVMIVL